MYSEIEVTIKSIDVNGLIPVDGLSRKKISKKNWKKNHCRFQMRPFLRVLLFRQRQQRGQTGRKQRQSVSATRGWRRKIVSHQHNDSNNSEKKTRPTQQQPMHWINFFFFCIVSFLGWMWTNVVSSDVAWIDTRKHCGATASQQKNQKRSHCKIGPWAFIHCTFSLVRVNYHCENTAIRKRKDVLFDLPKLAEQHQSFHSE